MGDRVVDAARARPRARRGRRDGRQRAGHRSGDRRRSGSGRRAGENGPRYLVEYWHLDEVSLLAVLPDAAIDDVLAPLRAAHASGVVVVVAEGTDEIVGWYPLSPMRGGVAHHAREAPEPRQARRKDDARWIANG